MALAPENVAITPQLLERECRQPDIQRANFAFQDLASHLITADPDKFLQRIVELTLELCDADTAGISVGQVDEHGNDIVRWVAMAGELEHLAGSTAPRHFSPCGMCVEQNQPILMEHLERAYPYFNDAPLPFVEALLLPWKVSDGGPAGALWVVAHSDRRKFDREDVRVMSCLAAFASGGIRLKHTLLESERAVAASQVVAAMAHHINNPLQGAIGALYCLISQPDLPAQVRELILLADTEVRRVANLSGEVLQKAL